MKKNIESLIFTSLDETVESLSNKIEVKKHNETNLFGGDGVLDSLGLVNFLINLEQKIEDTYGVELTIASEKAMSLKNSPFKTVGTLNDYLIGLLNEK